MIDKFNTVNSIRGDEVDTPSRTKSRQDGFVNSGKNCLEIKKIVTPYELAYYNVNNNKNHNKNIEQLAAKAALNAKPTQNFKSHYDESKNELT